MTSRAYDGGTPRSGQQGCFQAVYVGVGQGVGSLLGGVLMGRLGAQLMFAVCAAVVAAGWALSAAWDVLLRCVHARRADPCLPQRLAPVPEEPAGAS